MKVVTILDSFISNDVIENVRVALPDSYDTVAREVLEKKKNM